MFDVSGRITIMNTRMPGKIDDVTECSVCEETYRDPRVLPCVHTFCLKCIKGFSQNKSLGDCGACPLCRKEFTVPDEGIDCLPKNFFMEELTNVMITPFEQHCSGCRGAGTDEVTTPAVMYCVDCRQSYCEACAGTHRRMTDDKSCRHRLIDVCDEKTTSEAARKVATRYCTKHSQEAIKFYCFQCSEAICTTCFGELHQSHECSDVNQAAENFREQMANDIQNISGTLQKCRDMMTEQKKKRDDFSDAVTRIEK
jgi:RING-type zinc-finger/B-box zinc finger